MNKQFQGSKKKGRKKEFLEREAIRKRKIYSNIQLKDALVNNDIETAAKIMGVKLK